jgi:hypothetical protein
MKSLRKTVLAVVAAAALLVPARGETLELGMTPNHVVALWINVNAALVSTGRALDSSGKLAAVLRAQKLIAFSGKTAADVLGHVVRFRAKLDQLRAARGLGGTGVFKDPEGGAVTPSVVFMNSGLVLDSLVITLNRIDKDHLISGFYKRHDIRGKKHNHAYAMVDLANRRMDRLLAGVR